jgi:hypothetical protein
MSMSYEHLRQLRDERGIKAPGWKVLDKRVRRIMKAQKKPKLSQATMDAYAAAIQTGLNACKSSAYSDPVQWVYGSCTEDTPATTILIRRRAIQFWLRGVKGASQAEAVRRLAALPAGKPTEVSEPLNHRDFDRYDAVLLNNPRCPNPR